MHLEPGDVFVTLDSQVLADTSAVHWVYFPSDTGAFLALNCFTFLVTKLKINNFLISLSFSCLFFEAMYPPYFLSISIFKPWQDYTYCPCHRDIELYRLEMGRLAQPIYANQDVPSKLDPFVHI